MKKLMITAIVVALSSTTLVAQANNNELAFTAEQQQKMPAPFTDLLRRIQGKAPGVAAAEMPAAGSPAMNQYIKDSQDQIKGFKDELTALHKKLSYDPYAEQFILFADNLLNQVEAELKTIQNNGNLVSNKFGTVTDTITTLESYTPPVPTSPPGSCIEYRKNPVTCLRIEQDSNRNWRCYSPTETEVNGKKVLVDRYYGITDGFAGQTSGSPAILRKEVNVKVYLQNPAEFYNTPNNVVYCITQ